MPRNASNVPVGKPDSAIGRWIRRALATDPPRARSLIVTVWGDSLAPHGGEVWLSALIRLVAPFGCNERLVRTSVFRLARDGWLAATAAGRRSRYRLTAAGAHRFALAYRRVYTSPSLSWDGTWEVVLLPEALGAAARRTLREELAWEGFGALAPGVHARPARGGGDIAQVAAAHAARAGLTMFAAQDFSAAPAGTLADRVHAAYDLGTLAGEYRRFLARFTGVVDAFGRDAGDPEQAFVVRTLLVHEYRRARLRDPQLPLALLPHDWPGAAAHALCRDFYRLAQPLAESFLEHSLALDGDALLPALPEFYTRFADA
jgi:phenylacetic acid degradation operon negative regulatory protein